jgi:hypothetical protein
MLADVGKKRSAGDCPFPGWEPFLPHLVHPVKVAIVEALLWIGEPLSAVQFGRLLRGAGEGCRESNVRYHLKHLAEIGVLEPISTDPERGPREKFFDFSKARQRHSKSGR